MLRTWSGIIFGFLFFVFGLDSACVNPLYYRYQGIMPLYWHRAKLPDANIIISGQICLSING